MPDLRSELRQCTVLATVLTSRYRRPEWSRGVEGQWECMSWEPVTASGQSDLGLTWFRPSGPVQAQAHWRAGSPFILEHKHTGTGDECRPLLALLLTRCTVVSRPNPCSAAETRPSTGNWPQTDSVSLLLSCNVLAISCAGPVLRTHARSCNTSSNAITAAAIPVHRLVPQSPSLDLLTERAPPSSSIRAAQFLCRPQLPALPAHRYRIGCKMRCRNPQASSGSSNATPAPIS